MKSWDEDMPHIEKLKEHTRETVTVKSWKNNNSCKDTESDQIIYYPVSWQRLTTPNPGYLALLIRSSSNPTVSGEWKNGILRSKENKCREIKNTDRTERYDYICIMDVKDIKIDSGVLVTLTDDSEAYEYSLFIER